MTQIGAFSGPRRAGRALNILVVDDEPRIRGPLSLCVETQGHKVHEAANIEEAMACALRQSLDIALVDLRLGMGSGLDLTTRLLALLPRLKIIIITAYGAADVAVRAMTRGAADFLCKPFTPEQVEAAVNRAAALLELEADVAIMPDRWGTAGAEADFATTSAALEQAVATARQAAPAQTPILLRGEPGTGKGVLARAIHGWSRRPEGPFLAIDGAAHSPAYVDLALFGETLAGAQMVTAPEPPLLPRVAGGTLLIKNIEKLSTQSQERLAHALKQTADDDQRDLDFRLIATTQEREAQLHPSLQMMLDRIGVALPPLRQRQGDIPMLAQRYLAFARKTTGKGVLGISVEAQDQLSNYHWPGNLRELHGVIQGAFARVEQGQVEAAHLPEAVRAAPKRSRPRAGDRVSLRELEIAHIRETLAAHPSLQEAADILGLDLQALYRRRKQYGLE